MYLTALFCQLALLLFQQLTTLFDLYPFNNVHCFTWKERLAECLINGMLLALPFVGFVFHLSWLEVAALIIYPALLTGEYISWWHPYLFGATKSWREKYDRIFCHTLVVLPPIRNHPVPNLEHLLLHALSLLVTILTYIAYFTAL